MMALDDYFESEVGIAVAATAIVLSPQVQRWLRRGAVYGLAAALKAGDGISSAARGAATEVQQRLQEVVRSGTAAFTPVALVERSATTERVREELEAAPPEAAARRPLEFIGRADLVNVVMNAANTDAAPAERALDALLDGIRTALAEGEEVRLPGFGSFRVAQFQARRGRNPQTGEIMSIPERRRPVFRPGSRLREAVE